MNSVFILNGAGYGSHTAHLSAARSCSRSTTAGRPIKASAPCSGQSVFLAFSLTRLSVPLPVASDGADLPPVIVTPSCFIFHEKSKTKTGYIYFLATCDEEVSPISVSEFLRTIIDVFVHYFGPQFDESKLKSEFTTAYQLLDLLIHDGKPFITEMSVLAELVPMHSLVGKIVAGSKNDTTKKELGGKSYTGAGSAIKTSGPLSLSSDDYNAGEPHSAGLNTSYSLSNAPISSPLPSTKKELPWRKSDIKHFRNTIYFDFIENMDVIIGANGIPVISEVVGQIQARCEMSDIPELSIRFVNPGLLSNLCFSRYVDQSAWEKFKTIDFVPPEGIFKLATYRVCSGVTPPFAAHADFSLSETGGKMKVTVSTKQVMQGQLYFPESVVVDIPLPLDTVGVNFLASVGSFTFDQKQKVCRWSVGTMPREGSPVIEGTFTSAFDAEESQARAKKSTEFHSTLVARFSIPGYTASGVRVSSIDLRGVTYKAIKGTKMVTNAGSYQIRV